MIVVKVEIWPFGDQSKRQEIGRMYIANTGGDHIKGNYTAAETVEEIHFPNQSTIKIPSHTRSRGFWPLVKQAIAQLVSKRGL